VEGRRFGNRRSLKLNLGAQRALPLQRSRLRTSPAGPPHQFAAAIRTDGRHRFRTVRAKSAFIAANVSNIAFCQSASAFLALYSHL
jgi:hypothetical protein